MERTHRAPRRRRSSRLGVCSGVFALMATPNTLTSASSTHGVAFASASELPEQASKVTTASRSGDDAGRIFTTVVFAHGGPPLAFHFVREKWPVRASRSWDASR